MPAYQVTVRYGRTRQSYHTFLLTAPDVATALIRAPEQIPPEIAREADLVELRSAPDYDKRQTASTEAKTP